MWGNIVNNPVEEPRLRVWDLPLRLFHWIFALAIVGAIGSAKADVMWAHERLGLLILALLVFRVIWGFVGGHHARFANFLVWPRQLIVWMHRQRHETINKPEVGHSPLAGYSVLGLLGIPLVMAITGTVSTDGILFDGPLAHLVPGWNDIAAKTHHRISVILFALVGLHIAAIIFYKIVRKKSLTTAMIHGRADAKPSQLNGQEGHISAQKTVLGLLLMAGLIAAAQLLILLRPAYF